MMVSVPPPIFFRKEAPPLSWLSDSLKSFLRKGDLVLLSMCLAASGFGLVLIYSATRYTQSTRFMPVQSVAIVLGVISSVHQSKFWDNLIMLLSLVEVSTPSILVAIFVVINMVIDLLCSAVNWSMSPSTGQVLGTTCACSAAGRHHPGAGHSGKVRKEIALLTRCTSFNIKGAMHIASRNKKLEQAM